MPVSPEIQPLRPATESRHGLLVLGYQGTLTANPEHAPDRGPLVYVPQIPVDAWIAAARQRLDRRVPVEQQLCVDSGALVQALRERLTGILTQVLAVDPDAIPDAIPDARKYPALPALLHRAAEEWADAVAVFHERFHRDAARLAEWLGYGRLPEPASLTPARSDAHAGGHMVLRLQFLDGRAVYYKPRPVTGEWLWDRLVQAVNAHSSLQLMSAAALAGTNGRYGWVASLPPQPELQDWEKGPSQAAAYWQAAGATLCLAAQTRMTDLHLANMIATPRGPVPVDAESFGSPRMAAGAQPAHEPEPAADMLRNLLDTGLLPAQGSGDLPDVSGLFGRAAPAPGILVPRWTDDARGGHCLEMVPSILMDQGNAPPPGGSPLAVLPHLASGYREAAEALMRCRDSLVAPGSAWRQTLEQLHAPRIVLRDTLAYGLLLSQSLAPEQLRSGQRRRAALRKALQSRGRGALPAAVLRAELGEVAELHIPRFTALPGSRTLAASSGRALAQRFLACSPAQAVLRGMGSLSAQRVSDADVPALLLAVLAQPVKG